MKTSLSFSHLLLIAGFAFGGCQLEEPERLESVTAAVAEGAIATEPGPLEGVTSLPSLLVDYPFLQDDSLYYGYAMKSHPPPPRAFGEFGVGNGRVFALVGSDLPHHSLRNLIGPDYEKNEKFFSDKRFSLTSSGRKVDEGSSWVFRVRQTPLTLTRSLYTNGLELYTLDFAPRGGSAVGDWTERTLIRIFVAINRNTSPLRKLVLEGESKMGALSAGTWVEDVPQKHLAIRPLSGLFGETFSLAFPDLAPGEEAATGLILAFTYEGEDPELAFQAVQDEAWGPLLSQTYDWWTDWYAEGATVETPDARFNDLLEALQVSIKVQQAFTGATCVMSEYTRMWTRDTIGPVKFFSKLGRLSDVEDMLDYYWLAVLERQDIANSVASNVVLASLPPQPDWYAKSTMTGRLAAEGPSHLALQYGIYDHYTGDLTRVAERFGMLWHATAHQNFSYECLLPFSGDETFRDIMGVSYGYLVGMTVYEEEWFSANSSFLFAAAADQVADFASRLGKGEEQRWLTEKAAQVRKCTEDVYFLKDKGFYAATVDIDTLKPVERPYEDVNTMPLWSGAESPRDPHQVDQLLAVRDALYLEEGVIQSPIAPMYQPLLSHLGCEEGIMTGMSQGYYLEALTAIDHPEAEAAFNIWKRHFNDSGNLGEAMIRDDYTRLMYAKESYGIESDLTSRYRPWEGGIQGAALLRYLTGYEPEVARGSVTFAPHLPEGWTELNYVRIPFGTDRLSARITDPGGILSFELEADASPLTVHLTLGANAPILSLAINGMAQAPSSYSSETEWGRSRVRLESLTLAPRSTLRVEITY